MDYIVLEEIAGIFGCAVAARVATKSTNDEAP